MIISGLAQPAPAAPADIHVSIGGDDANDGSAALYSRVGWIWIWMASMLPVLVCAHEI